jgi:hypothetical protein
VGEERTAPGVPEPNCSRPQSAQCPPPVPPGFASGSVPPIGTTWAPPVGMKRGRSAKGIRSSFPRALHRARRLRRAYDGQPIPRGRHQAVRRARPGQRREAAARGSAVPSTWLPPLLGTTESTRAAPRRVEPFVRSAPRPLGVAARYGSFAAGDAATGRSEKGRRVIRTAPVRQCDRLRWSSPPCARRLVWSCSWFLSSRL